MIQGRSPYLAKVRGLVTNLIPLLRVLTSLTESSTASVHSQLLHGKQSFQRAICQSGVIGCLGPLPLESPFIQGVNDTLQAQLQAKSLHELRSATPAQLVQAMQKIYPDLPASFIVDDSNLAQGFFPPKTAWDSVPEFCKALLLGSCTNEVYNLGCLASQKKGLNPRTGNHYGQITHIHRARETRTVP